ncbi:MAG: cysteine--tRNA ligase [Candidatus Hepatoplasma vulgare]|nr:MAG: cysteine--tRNA ligase [Candidatus Hepatoplasma sp.]
MEIIDTFSNKKIKINLSPNIYLCGPTVYDYVHIGNVRPLIIFDILNRVMSLNGNVTYVHNLTDIDDKIIAQAQKENKNELDLSFFYAKDYLNLIDKLNIKKPTYLPKVSENMNEIIKVIDELIKKSFAYEKEDGIYFSIKKWDKYFKINNFSVDKLKISDLSREKNSFDFSLWKITKDNGIKFKSKWGDGRPGWHTECAALIMKYFKGKTIDLHGGGVDLKFPHHINEWAQFSALTGSDITRAWMHIGHVNFDNKKMSKSLGNTIYVRNFLKKYSSNVLKFLLISSFYTKPVNVNENSIKNAQMQVDKIRNLLFKLVYLYDLKENNFLIKKDEEFLKIINNNLNIPNSISLLNLYIKKINKNYDKEIIKKFLFILNIFGISYNIDFKLLNELKNKKMETDDLKIREVIKI